ncbi:MAG: hypothetical protein IKX85_00960 [Clostridia bacterium]|nr:hypothetical protein [Clostridia bacterium]
MKKRLILVILAVVGSLVLCLVIAGLSLRTAGVTIHKDIPLYVMTKNEASPSGENLMQVDGVLRYDPFTLSPVEFRGRLIVYGRYMPDEPQEILITFGKDHRMLLLSWDEDFPFATVGYWSLRGNSLLLIKKGDDFDSGVLFVSDKRVSRESARELFFPAS